MAKSVFYDTRVERVADQPNGADLSVRQLLRQPAGIGETVLMIYPSTGDRPKARRMLTGTTALQDQLASIYRIDRWAPKVGP